MPLYAARGLSTTTSLTWLYRMLLDAGTFWILENKNYELFWFKTASTVWCLVSCYLSFAFTDGLMLRWLFSYGPVATLVRLLVLNVFNYYIMTSILSLAEQRSGLVLPAWITIALILTGAYCVQDWLTSNIAVIDRDHAQRKLNFLEVAVFCVVPVGLASFFTMVMLLTLRLSAT